MAPMLAVEVALWIGFFLLFRWDHRWRQAWGKRFLSDLEAMNQTQLEELTELFTAPEPNEAGRKLDASAN